jgi:hypothetical protein
LKREERIRKDNQRLADSGLTESKALADSGLTESKALADSGLTESKALADSVFLESKALALGVFCHYLLAKVTVVLVPKAEALDSRIKLTDPILF